MIIVTIVSAVSMSFETPSNRVVDQPLLQVKIFIRQKKNIEILIFISIDCRICICYLYEC